MPRPPTTTIRRSRQTLLPLKGPVVLSHSKAFLCALWDGADTLTRSAVKIVRDGTGSTLAVWDVRQDSITEHDKRHEKVTAYIQGGAAADEREVAAALRHILEAFMRVAYPEEFPPGMLLGPFINVCQQRTGIANQLLSATDIIELRDLLDYANKFHHDTNAAAGVATAIGNHSFRATGITAYLKNGGTLEKATAMANHASTRTTQVYDRRRDEMSLDEVERISI
jgi:integrase